MNSTELTRIKHFHNTSRTRHARPHFTFTPRPASAFKYYPLFASIHVICTHSIILILPLPNNFKILHFHFLSELFNFRPWFFKKLVQAFFAYCRDLKRSHRNFLCAYFKIMSICFCVKHQVHVKTFRSLYEKARALVLKYRNETLAIDFQTDKILPHLSLIFREVSTTNLSIFSHKLHSFTRNDMHRSPRLLMSAADCNIQACFACIGFFFCVLHKSRLN